MARSLDVAALVTLAGSVVACTALLGDFEVGPSGPQTDGGSSGGEGGTSSGDARGDALADALVDAAPLPPVFKCVVNGSPTTLENAVDPNASERLGVHIVKVGGNAKRRVMWTGSNGTINFDTVDENLGGVIARQTADLVVTPQAAVSYAGGFAAIGLSFKSGGPRLNALRFDDGGIAPTTFNEITEANFLPAAISDLSIAAAHTGGDSFFVVLTYTLAAANSANTWAMYAGAVRIAPGAVPLPGAFKLVDDKILLRPSLDSDNLVIDRPDGRAILFMGADKGLGPMSVVQMDLQSGGAIAPPKVVPSLHAGATFQPLATQTDIAGDKVGLAFLEYDLNNASAPFYAYAAALPPLGFDKFQTTSLPTPVSFTKAEDIAVDKGRGFWTHFPGAGSHVVEAARATQTGKGVNFVWLDGGGHLRGTATGVDALAQTDAVKGAAGAMVDPPNQVIANATVTWLTDGGQLRIANVGCKN